MAVRSTLESLPTLLLRPHEFFAERPPEQSLGGALVVVLLVSLLATVAIAFMGWLFASSIDATVTRTVAEPWSDTACAGFESMERVPEPCTIDEPVTEEVEVGALVWDGFLQRLPGVFVGSIVGWFLVAAALHVVSALFDGEGSFLGTLSVAGWAMAPQVLQVALGVVLFSLTISGTDFSSDPAVLRRQVEDLASFGFGIPGAALMVVTVVWQAAIWASGLRAVRDLRPADATTAAAIVGLMALILALLG